MNKNEYINILQNPSEITKEQIGFINSLIKDFPFFQSSRAIYLKVLKNTENFKYNQELKGLPIKLPSVNDNIYSSFHLYIIQVNKKKDHKNLFNYLINKKIMVNLHYIPIYRHSYYQYLGFKKGLCKSSENYFKKAITLPIFPNLTNNQQKFIISSIKEFFK